MIATNEAVDVLRYGWQDAASTLAADVPEVAELLQARLELAIATERLDERHLLDTIQEVESVSSRAGSPSGQALARRLRRTVYEYLLALDAARPLETAKAPLDQPVTPAGSPMVGAEEVAALGHASRGLEDAETEVADESQITEAEIQVIAPSQEADPAPDAMSLADVTNDTALDVAEATGTDPQASRRRFGLRRRQRREPGPPEAGNPEIESTLVNTDPVAAEPPESEPNAPHWQFTAASEPAVFDAGLDVGSTGQGDAGEELDTLGDVVPSTAQDEPAAQPEAAPVSAAAEEGVGAEPRAAEHAGDASATFVAPRAGFHIVEDAPAHRADQEAARLEMPVFSADEDTASPVQPSGADDHGPPATVEPAAEIAPAGAGSEFLAWQPPISPRATAEQVAAPAESTAPEVEQPEAATPQALEPAETAPLAIPAVAHSAGPAPPQPGGAPAPAPVAAGQEAADEDDGESRGWGVRKHGQAHSPRRGAPAVAATPVEDDPFENNTRLSDMRRRIEERLRRKRCDEAAALLQEVAQETGGRAVAELAMNVGDRCRALGKSNAALNCYLAAARSDPVYELPLSRLADVCIDNQDTELAVSYLERIARIYRFREEDRAALRTYRRIATIAPYREDVLTLLMNAQRTGRLE